jgi:hypothetical protein
VAANDDDSAPGLGFASEDPQRELGGSIWDEPERWRSQVDGSGCAICLRAALGRNC